MLKELDVSLKEAGSSASQALALSPITTALEQSALLPVLESKLQNTSIIEMQRADALYGAVFSLCEKFAATAGFERV